MVVPSSHNVFDSGLGLKYISLACIWVIVFEPYNWDQALKTVQFKSRPRRGPYFIQSSSTQSHCSHPWLYLCGQSDLQGQAVQETDGQGSEISPHAAVSCDWPRSCVAGWWQSLLSEQSVRGLLFGIGYAGAWQEQLGHCTGFPLFMWGPGISAPAHCWAGGATPTASYCTIKSVEGHDKGDRRRWIGGFLPRILKDGHETVWSKMLYTTRTSLLRWTVTSGSGGGAVNAILQYKDYMAKVLTVSRF